MWRSFVLFFLISSTTIAEGYFIYIPYPYRQKNIRGSCVYASVANCMKTANLWQEADIFWKKYKGDLNGENLRGISDKLTRLGIKHVVIHDEQSLINALEAGRGAAVTWGRKHMVNLVGKSNNNAYIIDNERTNKPIVQSWQKFMSGFRRGGGWGIIILSGKPHKSITRDNLDGFLEK